MSGPPEMPPVGSTQHISVITRPDRPYLIADNSVVAQVGGPGAPVEYVELIAMTIQNRYASQLFTVVQMEDGAVALATGPFTGGMALEDQGAMRFTVQGAEDTAIGLVRHLIKVVGKDRGALMARLNGALDA